MTIVRTDYVLIIATPTARAEIECCDLVEAQRLASNDSAEYTLLARHHTDAGTTMTIDASNQLREDWDHEAHHRD